MKIFGHRGTRRGAPENTLSAMRLALAQGADGIEIDVRPCASGEVVVVHDPDLRRVADHRGVVAELALDELALIPLENGERVPSLRAVLELVLGASKLLNVEVKADVPDREAALDAVARELGELGEAERANVVISSFDRAMALELRARLPQIPVALLMGRRIADASGLDGVHPKSTLVNEKTLRAFRAQGHFVNVWTVNERAEALRLEALGVDGLITDDIPRIGSEN